MTTKYLTGRETRKAALIALKKHFKGTKFSVKTGGGDLRVSWIDGPSDDDVEAVLDGFAAKGFDGSVDYEFHKTSWLLSDGTLVPATSGGSALTGGYDEGYDIAAPEEGAVKAVPSTDCVFTERTFSKEQADKILAKVLERGVPENSFRIEADGTGFMVRANGPEGRAYFFELERAMAVA